MSHADCGVPGRQFSLSISLAGAAQEACTVLGEKIKQSDIPNTNSKTLTRPIYPPLAQEPVECAQFLATDVPITRTCDSRQEIAVKTVSAGTQVLRVTKVQ